MREEIFTNAPVTRNAQIRTAACAIIRNEERNILEWVAYHRVIGFDEIIVLNNSSSDRTAEVVEDAASALDVTQIDWTSTEPDRQMRAYEHVCHKFADEFDWIAFLDGDEFLVPERDASVEQMLQRRQTEAAVAVGWLIYGSDGHVAPPEELVIESFLARSQNGFEPNRHVKSIVRPKQVVEAKNPHYFTVDGRYSDVDGAAVDWLTPGLSRQPLATRSWRINHYMTRSAEHWARRLARRQPGNNARRDDEFRIYDRNEVFDLSASRYGPRVTALMAKAHSLV